MFPKELIFGLSLYDFLIGLGVIIGFIIFNRLLKEKGVPRDIRNFYFNLLLLSLAIGFFCANVFQVIYNYLATKEFSIYGMTYLGGFVGGSISFLLLYKLRAKEEEKKYIHTISYAAICGLLIGHFFGRLGCFTDGCCYGKPTELFVGVRFPGFDTKVHPTQLYEAFILLVMFFLSTVLYRKDKNVIIFYLITYGISRFLIEILRGDDRGKLLPGLSPSQFISLVLVVIGASLLLQTYFSKHFADRKNNFLDNDI